MKSLSERQYGILRLRSLGWPFEEIGVQYMISSERARQIYDEAIRLQGQAVLVSQFPSLKPFYP